jgi:hypothetical protein
VQNPEAQRPSDQSNAGREPYDKATRRAATQRNATQKGPLTSGPTCVYGQRATLSVGRVRSYSARSSRNSSATSAARHNGYEATREAAMAAFVRSWRREGKAWTGRLPARFRTIQVWPKDLPVPSGAS